MLITIKTSLLALFLSVLFVPGARAQGTYTAASCNQSDVNAVLNGPTHTAVNGDIINIPSCAGGVTWTSGITVNGVCITIQGNGTPNSGAGSFGAGTINTLLIDALNGGGTPLIKVTGIPYSGCSSLASGSGQYFRISTLAIQPGSSVTNGYSPITLAGTCTASGCPEARLDNLRFSGWSEGGNGNQSAWMLRTDGVYGVVDHNTIPSGSGNSIVLANSHHSSWLGVGGNGDNSWASSDSFGTSSQIYFENNSLSAGTLDCDEAPPGGGQGGCRVTIRFSQFTIPAGQSSNAIAYTHGTETTGRTRGTRQIEVYGNTVSCANNTTGCTTGAVGMRSGVGRVFGNTFTTTGGGFINDLVELDAYRTIAGFSPWNWCNGLGPYDDNDGTTYVSGTISSASVSSGTLTVTDTSKSWTTNQWVGYSIVDTTLSGSPGYEITSSTSNSVSASNYGADYWNGPPTFSAGNSYEILRASACIDQPGRSGGTLLSGSTPSPAAWVGETLDPVYEWMDSTTSLNHGVIVSDSAKMVANRDWYAEGHNQAAQTSTTSPFNGSSGTGHGTLANRPTSCTPSVGYWATDQGSWNQSGNSFGQGELFVCTATDTWESTPYYVPFAYPHPLQGGAAPTLEPPTGVHAVGH